MTFSGSLVCGEAAADGVDQHFGVDRPFQRALHPDIAEILGRPRHDHDGNLTLSELRRELHAAEHRQAQVHDNEIGRVVVQVAQRLEAVGGFGDDEPRMTPVVKT